MKETNDPFVMFVEGTNVPNVIDQSQIDEIDHSTMDGEMEPEGEVPPLSAFHQPEVEPPPPEPPPKFYIENWFDAIENVPTDPPSNRFVEFGNYKHCVTVQYAACFHRHSFTNDIEDVIDQCVYDAHEHHIDDHEEFDPDTFNVKLDPRNLNHKSLGYSLSRPFFGWLPPYVIKETYQHTTQYARLPHGTLLKHTFKSSNARLNITRSSEAVACDVVYSDVPAADNGATAAVIFAGLDTQVTDIYGIETEDNIQYHGAPTKLISDRAQVEISKKVLDILRTLCIGDWQSEPHQQQQNPAERRFQTVKNAANRIMDRTGAPPSTWLLCLMYVCFLLNHTYNSSIGDVPLQALTGSTPDISVLLKFFFWQKVYYKKVDSSLPSESTEALGHIASISEHCELACPYSEDDLNLCADMSGGEEHDVIMDPIIESKQRMDLSIHANTEPESEPPPVSVFCSEELIGCTFHLDSHDNGEIHRAKIVQLIEEHESQVKDNPTMLRFLLSITNDQAEEIIMYSKLLDYISKDEKYDVVWKFTSHQGPRKPEHPDYKGSLYNLMIEWEIGETTIETLNLLVADGHPTDIPLDAVYSGVVSLCGFRLVIFLGELIGLKTWSTDKGNAYLGAMTSESLHIIAGPGFGELEGHNMIVHRAIYGLRSSGARWHDKYVNCLRDLRFGQCKAEPDILMKENCNAYEYIAVYANDLAIAINDLQEFISLLENKHKLELKGTGPITVHLGMNFVCDEEGEMLSVSQYIVKMIGTYLKFFGEQPKHNVLLPLNLGDNSDYDTSELLNVHGTIKYQFFIEALQLAVSIGRLVIQIAMMTLSGFRVAPRRGHLDRVKRVYAYLSKMRHAAIRVGTEEPDYFVVPDFEYDSAQTVYGDVKEHEPDDVPKSLGKYVTLTQYENAKLMHNVTTGRSVKEQETVETTMHVWVCCNHACVWVCCSKDLCGTNHRSQNNSLLCWCSCEK
jgi:hypothetical protein